MLGGFFYCLINTVDMHIEIMRMIGMNWVRYEYFALILFIIIYWLWDSNGYIILAKSSFIFTLSLHEQHLLVSDRCTIFMILSHEEYSVPNPPPPPPQNFFYKGNLQGGKPPLFLCVGFFFCFCFKKNFGGGGGGGGLLWGCLIGNPRVKS